MSYAVLPWLKRTMCRWSKFIPRPPSHHRSENKQSCGSCIRILTSAIASNTQSSSRLRRDRRASKQEPGQGAAIGLKQPRMRPRGCAHDRRDPGIEKRRPHRAACTLAREKGKFRDERLRLARDIHELSVWVARGILDSLLGGGFHLPIGGVGIGDLVSRGPRVRFEAEISRVNPVP